jgi:hypothetical protein
MAGKNRPECQRADNRAFGRRGASGGTVGPATAPDEAADQSDLEVLASSKLESSVAQARRVVMAYGLAGAHREELKDKQLPSLRMELRSNRLNGSGMNKIVQSRSATPSSIKRSK